MKDSSTKADRKKKWAQGLFALIFWLLIWQALYLLVDKPFLLVSPLSAALRLLELFGSLDFWLSVSATCLRVAYGFLSALLVGIALSFGSARYPLVRKLFTPILGVVRATPVASFIILALIWISTGRLPVFIAFLMVLPMVYSNLCAGLSKLDIRMLEMARLFRFSKGKALRLVCIPQLVPYLTAASTAGLGFAWKSVVAAEVIAHPSLSVGKQIYNSKIYFETADLFAWTIAVIILSVIIERAALRGLRSLERSLTRPRLSRTEKESAATSGGSEEISLRGVAKSYGSLSVLKDFSLTLPRTGSIALMGPSGCGKTTLLRLVSGLEKPDAGEMTPFGGRISMVFQEDRLLPWLSASENVLAVLPAGKASAELAARTLAACGLSGFEASLPGELSGGMRRRVAVARAVAYGGEVLLLDEPFKGLDEITKLEMEAFVKESMPSLTLLVTHDRQEALRMSDSILSFTGPPLSVDEFRR